MGGGQREPSVVSWNGDTTPKASEDVSVTLRSQQGGEGVGVAHAADLYNFTTNDQTNQTLRGGAAQCKEHYGAVIKENLTVRRLTPIECERLQGFPDNWTSEKMELILEGNEWKATGKVVKQADGPRYKQMGNAITVNVGAWIGKQIEKVLDK
jgi:DNA (cytosine-5)-methyltransferase 1